MPAINVYKQYFAVQYNGSNGEECATLLETFVVSDTGTVLQLDVFGDLIPLGKWIVWCPAIPGQTGAERWLLDDYTSYFTAS